MLRIVVLSLLACAALAADVQAQLQVSPADHVLLIPQGKSRTIKVWTVSGCTPTWSFDVAAAAWFDVSGDTPGPAKARTYKLSAKGPIGGFTNARIDAEGVGPDCADDESLLIRILIVDKDKGLEKQLVGGDKKATPAVIGLAKRFATFRKAVVQATKNLKADIKEILAKHKAGVFLQPVPGGMLTQGEIAMYRYQLESADTLDELYDAYELTLFGMAADGANVLVANGHTTSSHITAPRAFQPGAGEEWDQWRRRLSDELERAGRGFGDAERQFIAKLRKQSLDQGEPFFVSSSSLDLPDPGAGLLSPVSGAAQPGLPDLSSQKTAAILRVSGSNRAALGGFFLASGRIQVHGRIGNTESIIVTFQRLDSNGLPAGDVQGDVFEVDPDDQSFRLTWPEPHKAATLSPGTWRVSVSGGGTNVVARLVTVPGS